MVDDARRYHVHVDVGEHVGAHDHGRVVVVECLHHLGQCVLVGVHVVRVKLHAEFAGFGMLGAHVPAAADAQVGAFGDDVYHARVGGEFLNSLARAVCRVVVDDDEVEGEVGLLREHAADGVADGAYAVAHGDDDRSLVLEVAAVEFYLVELRFEISSDGLEVSRAGFFHLYLDAAVFGVDVVEDAFAALVVRHGHVSVEVFVDVHHRGDAAHAQTQVVESGGGVCLVDFG